jgi:hypothetical protein
MKTASIHSSLTKRTAADLMNDAAVATCEHCVFRVISDQGGAIHQAITVEQSSGLRNATVLAIYVRWCFEKHWEIPLKRICSWCVHQDEIILMLTGLSTQDISFLPKYGSFQYDNTLWMQEKQ